MNRLRTKLWLLAITPLLMIGLAACGVGTTPTTTASSAPTAGAQASATAPASSGSIEQPSAAASATGATAAASTIAASSPAAETSTAATTAIAKLDLNTVSEDDLLSTIPDFGNRTVREFMEYRPYASIMQFRQEIGKYVDAEQVALYEQYVYVPVDVNKADAATLQQLPGVDAAIAEQLIAARSFDSNATFLATLAEYVSPTDAAAAAAYLAAQ